LHAIHVNIVAFNVDYNNVNLGMVVR